VKKRTLLVLAIAIVLLACGVALARPGGGHTYSGGGGHYSSSGGSHSYSSSGGSSSSSGDSGVVFELIYYLILLCFQVPAVGFSILTAGVLFVIFAAYRNHANKDWDSGPAAALHQSVGLGALRQIDADFSQIVFEDFAFRLFSTAHRARASAQTIGAIAPYVNEHARGQLSQRSPVGVPVQQVVVGALRVIDVDLPGPQSADSLVRVRVEYEANVATAQDTMFSVETWQFARDVRRTSKPPGARDFPCPNCGAPWQASATGTQVCASCNQVVDNGRFDWIVDSISVAEFHDEPPTLTTDVKERGTDLPTYRAPDALAEMGALLAADPQVTHDAIDGRLALIYNELNRAWAANDLRAVRGLVSDGLYDYLQYWIDAYRKQGLRNELVDMRITRSELAKVARDRWYDAITIRVWGTGKDFTVRVADGAVVTGSKRRERAYSEYWTLVRSAARRGPARATATCGNCGAPLAISMAGACEHCGAHVTGGEFDWVLSKIEQDDSYRG
jgi:hypothetical protein